MRGCILFGEMRLRCLAGCILCHGWIAGYFLTVLKQMEVFPAVIQAERERYLPFLLTTTIMMEAVKTGAGREDAHEAIKEHAVGVVTDLRTGKIRENNLVDRLAKDSLVGLKKTDLQKILKDGQGRIEQPKHKSLLIR